MKTSFPLKSKRKRVIDEFLKNDADDVVKESIKSFDAETTIPGEDATDEAPLVIPLPPSLAERGKEQLADNETPSDAQDDPQSKRKPLLIANLDPRLLSSKDDGDRFSIDVSLRADDVTATEENYKAVPVSKFGEAMLRGMGWSGLSKEDEAWAKQVDNVAPRDAMLGLGAVAKPPDANDKRKSSADKNESKVKAWDAQVERKLASQKLSVGDIVWLKSVAHVGQRATVEQTQGIPGLNRIRIRLEATGIALDVPKGEAVAVTTDDLTASPFDYSKIEAATAPKNATAVCEMEHEHATKRPRLEGLGAGADKASSGGAMRAHLSTSDVSSSCQLWCIPGIRVRVVSRKVDKSIYLCKGTVKRVHVDTGMVSVLFGEEQGDPGGRSAVQYEVKPKYLETVVPKVGRDVRVLVGPHRGKLGVLQSKNKSTGQVVVSMDGVGDASFLLDDVAEWRGQ